MLLMAHWFMLTPLIGGYLADKFIGYRKSIIFGGILMALGTFLVWPSLLIFSFMEPLDY